LGSSIDTFVSRENIGYVAQCSKNNVSKTFELLSDIVLNSKYEVESVRKNVIHDKEAIESNTKQSLFEYLHQAAFQKSPLERSPFGELETLSNISKDQVVNYVNTHYTGPRVVVSGTGPVTHEELVQLSGKHFEKLSPGYKVDFNTLGDMDFIGSEIRIRDDEMHDAHVLISLQGVSSSDPDYYTFKLIQILFGSWDVNSGGGQNLPSRLAEKMSTEKLAYSFDTFNINYKKNGIFGIHAVLPQEDLDDATYAIQNQWMRISKHTSDRELQRAKNKLKTNILNQWSCSTSVTKELARQIFSQGKVFSPSQIFSEIDSISVSDIRKTMDNYFNDVDVAIVGMGPIEDLPDYLYFRSRTFWYRF